MDELTAEAIYEAISILHTLAEIDHDQRWLDSVFTQNLDRIARKAGFEDAQTASAFVEEERRDEAEKWQNVYDVP